MRLMGCLGLKSKLSLNSERYSANLSYLRLFYEILNPFRRICQSVLTNRGGIGLIGGRKVGEEDTVEEQVGTAVIIATFRRQLQGVVAV